jgi:hypothetical protein
MNILTYFLIQILMWNITNFHLKKYGECKMQLDNNEFNTFKMNDSTHVQMLIVQ